MSHTRTSRIPLLSRDTVRSRSISELRDSVQRHAVVHDVEPRGGGRPDGFVSFAAVGALSLVYIRYGAPVVVDAFPTRNRFTLTVPLGPMKVSSGEGQPFSTLRSGFALFQEQHTMMLPDPVAGALVVSTTTSRLEEHLAGLTGRVADRTLRFLPPSGGGAAGPPELLETSWHMVCRTLSSAPAGGLGALVERHLEEVLLSGILMGLPHTGTPALAGDVRTCLPGDVVERGRQWLEEHYEEPVTVHDLAHAMNLSARQLQHLFRERYGKTPIEVLRDIRFRQARRLLMRPRPSGGAPTVAAVAHRCGFTHLSRFSIAYRQRFGESPSETVRQAPWADAG
ncbi:AraC family transcriptional regulator [Streptomyces abyssomicinicus]|uniref:AraC family transcriptional regulator n=1 Tax=Streptomyces abyssomicinicus TaxID=574929 RepID=UPI0013DE9FC1|nr:AraC family transcriptional regulator [Streptomyces abyssomicinicus]